MIVDLTEVIGRNSTKSLILRRKIERFAKSKNLTLEKAIPFMIQDVLTRRVEIPKSVK